MRYSTPRRDVPVPALWPAVLLAVAMGAGLIVVARLAYRSVMRQQPAPLTTAGYGSVKVYEVTDPVTGVEYLVTDRGGICVREGVDDEQERAG